MSADSQHRQSLERLAHAHNSRIHFVLDEIRDDLRSLREEILATGFAFDCKDPIMGGARLKNLAVMERAQEIAAEVAILREMLGVR